MYFFGWWILHTFQVFVINSTWRALCLFTATWFYITIKILTNKWEHNFSFFKRVIKYQTAYPVAKHGPTRDYQLLEIGKRIVWYLLIVWKNTYNKDGQYFSKSIYFASNCVKIMLVIQYVTHTIQCFLTFCE